MVAGEGATRYVRKDLLGMADGATISTLADAGIGIAAGMGAEKVLGRQAGRDVTAGVFAYILRSIAKQLGVAKLTEVLGDSGGGSHRYIVQDGRLIKAPLAGYVGRGSAHDRLAGYTGRGNGMTLSGEQESDLGY